MGITGLLPFLKSIQRQVNISLFRGKKVAVDAYCWLHKGAYSCPMELIMGPKEGDKIESLPFLKYCVKRVKMLLDKGVTPIIVFDGSQLPIKSKVEAERRKRRKEYREKGKALLREGKRSEAHDCFQKCIDVSPEMAHAFIKACHEMKVECIVAPYEADSQLAYLSMQGIVDLVITEDSDLLVFGCKKVLFKMDEIGGGFMIDSDDFGTMKDGKLTNFTLDEFRQMCILSGCDYLPSVPGIGLSTAHKLMKKYAKNVNNVIKVLKFDKGKLVPSNYWEQFQQAELTFKHQLVFDPQTQKQVPLTPLPEGTDQSDYDFAGAMVSPCKAVGLARGNINPLTHEVMDTFSPSKTSSPTDKHRRWSSSGMATSYRHYSTPIQANLHMFSSSEKSRQKFKPPRKTDNNNDMSSDNATLLSYYNCSTSDEASLVEPEGHSDDHVTSSDAPDPADKSHTVTTISRFFTGQNGCTSYTPHNPFSLSKSRAVAAGSAARKLNLSFIHDNSVESERGKPVFDMSKLMQDDNIDVIEQSPVKDMCNGYTEDTDKTSMSDEVAIVVSPSSPPADKDVKLPNDEMDSEEDCKIYTPSQSEQQNVSMVDDGENINHKNIESIEQTTSTNTKKLGHCDLREFSFIRRSERDQRPPQNSRSLSLPSISDNISSTPNRKVMSSEDFLCPLERKKHKTIATENELEGSTIQVHSVQEQRGKLDTNLKTHEPKNTRNVPQSISKVSNRKAPTPLSRSSSFSTKRSKGALATDSSLKSGQLNLKKYAFTTRKENVLRLSRQMTFVENSNK